MAKTIGLKKALEFMSRKSRLMMMHTTESPYGKAYYVVPGGHIKPDVAQKIISRPDVRAAANGLFPGQNQTWTMV